jgi:hypothetical protein
MILIIYGATGKIGTLATPALLAEFECIYVGRTGLLINQKNSNIVDLLSLVDENLEFGIVDLSVDYTCVKSMQAHENSKTDLIDMINNTGKLKAYVGISSGAAQFSDAVFKDDFKLKYAHEKRKRKNIIKQIGVPYFYPDIFTLIGPTSSKYKNIGWVDVMNNCLYKNEVAIGKPYELRSWVSELSLIEAMKDFIRMPNHSVEGGLVDGVFCLQDIVDIIEEFLEKKIIVTTKYVNNWLSVAYVNQTKMTINSTLHSSLKDTILSIILEEKNHVK